MAKTVRGALHPQLIRGDKRQGDNDVVLMFGGGSSVAGNALVFDATGCAIDGGSTPGGANFADNETPSGALNGSNQTYTLAHTPIAASLRLYANGVLLLQATDYTLATATITLVNLKPNSTNNEWMKAWYRY
jgi:hypothetical protein